MNLAAHFYKRLTFYFNHAFINILCFYLVFLIKKSFLNKKLNGQNLASTVMLKLYEKCPINY